MDENKFQLLNIQVTGHLVLWRFFDKNYATRRAVYGDCTQEKTKKDRPLKVF